MGAMLCSNSKKTVAIVSTSASSFEGYPTGLWLEEMAAPYYTFLEAGYEVDIVSIAGGEPPVDAGSRGEGFYTEEAKRFDADPVAQAKFKASKKLSDVAVVDCLYLAGGHGTCVDFPKNETLIGLIEKMYAEGKVVAADCHGPVALLNCKKPNGEPLVKGLDVTGFSNTEENTVQHMDKCKKLDVVIEDKFKALGGNYSKADDWNSKVCAAGNLVTGQNPQSSKELAAKCVELLSAAV
jgi:putative intracellular protease/amidase